jgi:hypothetical protein
MRKEELKALCHGDIVRHKSLGSAPYTVLANYGDRVVAVRAVDLTNPIEWDQIDQVGRIISHD